MVRAGSDTTAVTVRAACPLCFIFRRRRHHGRKNWRHRSARYVFLALLDRDVPLWRTAILLAAQNSDSAPYRRGSHERAGWWRYPLSGPFFRGIPTFAALNYAYETSLPQKAKALVKQKN